MKLAAVVFDMQGTLFHTETAHQQAVRSVFETYTHAALDPDELRAYVGLPYEDRFIHLLAMRGIDDEALVQQLSTRAEHEYTQIEAVDHGMVPGLRRLLQELHQASIPLAIVSSATHRTIEQMIAGADIDSYFSIITGGDDVQYRKPHPQPYTNTVRSLKTPPEQTIAFEDSPTGVESATLAGIRCVGLTTTYTADDLHRTVACIPDYTAISVADITALIAP